MPRRQPDPPRRKGIVRIRQTIETIAGEQPPGFASLINNPSLPLIGLRHPTGQGGIAGEKLRRFPQRQLGSGSPVLLTALQHQAHGQAFDQVAMLGLHPLCRKFTHQPCNVGRPPIDRPAQGFAGTTTVTAQVQSPLDL